MTPTSRSKAELTKRGAQLVAVVERWNPHARIRQDLFGIFDLLAIHDGETIAVQTTSRSNMSARIRKIQDSEAIAACRAAGWRILVHGWAKNKSNRWELKETDIS